MASRVGLKEKIRSLMEEKLLEILEEFKEVTKDVPLPKRKNAQGAMLVLAQECAEEFFELHKNDCW